MAPRTPLAPTHGAGGVFCVEALGRARGGRRPTAGQAQAASAHGAKRRHRPPTPRGHSGGRARLAHRRSPLCSQKNGSRPTKTRSFCAITPRFLRRGGSAAERSRKAARNHGHNRRKDENINFSPPNHQQKHVFTPCTSGEMQAEIRTFRRLERKPGGGVFILFQSFPNEKQKKNRQRTEGCATNCAFSRFDPLTLSNHPTIARVDAQNQRFVLSLRGAQWAKNTRFGCAIPRFSCKSDDKNRLFHLRRPLIPF